MSALARYAFATAWHGTANWAKVGARLAMHQVDEEGELGPTRYSHISANELESEASKLLRLCWSKGFRPSQRALAEIMMWFTKLISEHPENTSEGKCIDLYTDPEAFLNSGCTRLTPGYERKVQQNSHGNLSNFTCYFRR